MELDHDFTVPVPVDQAWSVLLDVERVAACMPGATLDAVEGEEYKGRMKVKVGAMTITYRGSARIVVADEESRIVTLEASAKEARGSGTASATVQATLRAEDGTTRVTVHTKLNVTGRPAQFGRNILSEVGSKIITRFANALAEELESPGAAPAATETAATETAKPKTPRSESAEPETAKSKSAESTGPESTTTGPAGEEPAGKDGPEPADKPGPATAAVVEPVTGPAAEAPAAAAQRPSAPAERPGRPLRVAGEDDAIDLLEVAGPSVVKRAVPAAGGLVVLLLVLRFLIRRRRGKR